MSILLPSEKPSGEQYEDLVAAAIRCLGYFIETRVKLKGDRREVLEIDIVGTPTGGNFLNRILFEAKKSGRGFSSVFKLYGQRLYLGIDEGRVIHWASRDPALELDLETVGRKTNVYCAPLNINASTIDNLSEVAPECLPVSDTIRSAIIGASWWHMIAQRLAHQNMISQCNSNPGDVNLQAAKHYSWSIDQAFFLKEPIKRAEALYQSWYEAPTLAGQIVQGLAESTQREDSTIWRKLTNDSTDIWLQHVLLLEHKARIGIIKSALEYCLQTGKFLEDALDSFAEIPPSFRGGLKQLLAFPYREHIPYLFQIFIETFGGFISIETPDELPIVAQITGLPEGEVIKGLALLDSFFPFGGDRSWYFPLGNFHCIKLIPGYIRGCGAFFRRHLYDIEGVRYDSKFPSKGALLQRWHSALYAVLKEELESTNT